MRRAEKHAAINQPGEAAAALQALGHVVTKVRCDRATPDGSLWDKVIGKLQALHPEPSRPLTHDFFPHPTQTEWPCGLSKEMKNVHFAAKGLALFKGTTDQWDTLLAGGPDIEDDDWGVRPLAIGTSMHNSIARAQWEASGRVCAPYFHSCGQFAFGTRRGMDLLFHHHRLHKDMLPTEIAQMQDGSNAFNEMEPCAIAEGIATAPIVHRAFYNYFISATIDPTPVYTPGSTLPVYWVKKGSKQGFPQGPSTLGMGGPSCCAR